MFEITRYETERRLVGTGAIAVGLALFAGLFLAIAPDILAQADLDQLLEAYPEPLVEAFGIETLGTLEGFLATELYQFGFVLLLGLYFAYSAGATIAGDVEHGRMDVLLSNPVSRSTVVTEKFLSLLVPIVVVNLVVGAVVYGGSVLIDDPLAPADVLAVHALSIPYLLACGAIGLVLSVLVSRESVAQRGAIAAVFGLFAFETVVAGTEYAWLGAIGPTRYYDPTAILVDGTYDLVGAAVLLGATVALVVVSGLWFRRKDVR